MHFRTHVKNKLRGISGQNEYADGMVEHDRHIGQFLDKLDELGIADNTIVFYSTDNGPHLNTWPDAGMPPFRGEKNTNWEGGWRLVDMATDWRTIYPETPSADAMRLSPALRPSTPAEAAISKPLGYTDSCRHSARPATHPANANKKCEGTACAP